MADPVRIANCSGFYGDRLSAAEEMVLGGPIDVLTGDWLAELTMLILARTQMKGGGGYARTFVVQMERVMGTCLDRGIKVVSNAGGLNPQGCAAALAAVAATLGLHPTIAYVEGDDLSADLDKLVAKGALVDFTTGEPFAEAPEVLSANAYIGCWGIVEALRAGADIVVTGRTTDAAVVCGPAAWRHGWARDDWDQLAGAVVAGHIIECGTQATGGNYSFFDEVPGLSRIGFPWVEIAADGSSVVGKHPGLGGLVSVGTVTSQLLYEIGSPAYLGPDVTARFDTIELGQIGADRVRVSGVRGEPPPATLKVGMNEVGGHRNDLAIGLVGLDVEAKAQVVEEAFWAACPYTADDFDRVAVSVDRTDKVDPTSNEEATAIWRMTLRDRDANKVGRAVSNALVELGLASVPGFFLVGGRPPTPTEFGVYRPALVPAELVPQRVVVDGAAPVLVEPVASSAPVTVHATPGPVAAEPTNETAPAAFGRIVGARSGDKGGNANLGVFARTDAAWVWLDSFLTVERLRALLPEVAPLRVDRHRLPSLRSLNFVVHGLLQEGVAASTRPDPQAKSLGEWLRARIVDVPMSLLEEVRA